MQILRIEDLTLPRPAPPPRRGSRTDALMTFLHQLRGTHETLFSRSVALNLLSLQMSLSEDEPAAPGQDGRWRTVILEAMQEAASARSLSAFDRLRDLLIARLAFRYPAAFQRCHQPFEFDGLYELHARAGRLLRASLFDDLLALAGPALMEASMAYGQDHDAAIALHRRKLEEGQRLGARIRYLPSADALLVPLHDGFRFRLLDSTAVHALSYQTDSSNGCDPLYRYEWGAIYGFFDNAWSIVGFD